MLHATGTTSLSRIGEHRLRELSPLTRHRSSSASPPRASSVVRRAQAGRLPVIGSGQRRSDRLRASSVSSVAERGPRLLRLQRVGETCARRGRIRRRRCSVERMRCRAVESTGLSRGLRRARSCRSQSRPDRLAGGCGHVRLGAVLGIDASGRVDSRRRAGCRVARGHTSAPRSRRRSSRQCACARRDTSHGRGMGQAPARRCRCGRPRCRSSHPRVTGVCSRTGHVPVDGAAAGRAGPSRYRGDPSERPAEALRALGHMTLAPRSQREHTQPSPSGGFHSELPHSVQRRRPSAQPQPS